MINLSIEGQLPSWNKFYAGMHHTKRTELKNEWRLLVRQALGPVDAPLDYPVSITVYCEYKGSPVDCDNVCAKLIIDGLVQAGLLVDDTPEYVRWCTTAARKTGRNLVNVEVVEATQE